MADPPFLIPYKKSPRHMYHCVSNILVGLFAQAPTPPSQRLRNSEMQLGASG